MITLAGWRGVSVSASEFSAIDRLAGCIHPTAIVWQQLRSE
jgi:hypothetical protein